MSAGMGSFTEHLAWAMVVATTAFIIAIGDWLNIARLGAFLLGSVFPDIDHRSSKIHRYLLFPRLAAAAGARFKHWGHNHSIVAGILYSIPVALIDLATIHYLASFAGASIYFFLGFFLHLVVDEMYKSPGNKRVALKAW